MGLILLEALLALLIFIGIVWWTMFSGRSKGELRQTLPPADQPPNDDKTQHADTALRESPPTAPSIAPSSTASSSTAPTTASTDASPPDETRR